MLALFSGVYGILKNYLIAFTCFKPQKPRQQDSNLKKRIQTWT